MKTSNPLIIEIKKIETDAQLGHLRPIWWDGFCNVILRGETSSPDDNPYTPDLKEEDIPREMYEEGAKAGESLIRSIIQQEAKYPDGEQISIENRNHPSSKSFVEVLEFVDERKERLGYSRHDLVKINKSTITIYPRGPGKYSYPIHHDQIKTPEDLVGWTIHLLEKGWGKEGDYSSSEIVREFLLQVCQNRGWKNHC